LALGSVAAVGWSVGIYGGWLREEGRGKRRERGRMGSVALPGRERV
jgi:hypothetical protein